MIDKENHFNQFNNTAIHRNLNPAQLVESGSKDGLT